MTRSVHTPAARRWERLAAIRFDRMAARMPASLPLSKAQLEMRAFDALPEVLRDGLNDMARGNRAIAREVEIAMSGRPIYVACANLLLKRAGVPLELRAKPDAA